MGGIFDGSAKVNVSYRDQWNSILGNDKFQTIALDANLKYSIFDEDNFSINVSGLFDQAGAAFYSQALLHVGGAYTKKLSGTFRGGQYLSAGFNAGIGQNSINWGKLWFDRQFDRNTGLVNTDLGNGEPNVTGNSGRTDFYPDMSFGVFWYTVIEEVKSFHAGFSAHHLNQPDVSLSKATGANSLFTKWTVHAGGQFPIDRNASLIPSTYLSMQGPSLMLVMGAALKYNGIGDGDSSMRIGLWNRFANGRTSGTSFDSFIVEFGFGIKQYSFGISYDFTVSSLAAANKNRGAFELSFSYTRPAGDSRNKVMLPQL